MPDPSFEELSQQIRNSPITWLPGLFTIVAVECATRGVFQGGGMERRLQHILKDPQGLKDKLDEDLKGR